MCDAASSGGCRAEQPARGRKEVATEFSFFSREVPEVRSLKPLLLTVQEGPSFSDVSFLQLESDKRSGPNLKSWPL